MHCPAEAHSTKARRISQGMIDLSKYPASRRSYYSHVDRGGAVCAGVACLAIIFVIPIVGRGCLPLPLVCAVVVVFPFALCAGALVSRSAVRPVESR